MAAPRALRPEALVDELKVRARVQLNRARREGQAGATRLRDALHEVARESGFADWEHARRVLSGLAAPGEDLGSFWHAAGTGILLHIWFASHEEGRAVVANDPGGFLLPYRRQCFMVQAPFIEALGLDPQDAAWAAIDHDLVAGYGSEAWRVLSWQRLRALQRGA
ncbi:hypothetical protein [Comamonas sp. GB3 AK4-5]|uniref:hypothetical protein n=1 Tax=Comamonas sp. GB3 AK4-5 TaxID=3231487 RepID=UPI00351F6627